MPAFRSMTSFRSADVVVVGGGTVGAWTAVLLAESGVPNVVLIEARTLGDGASSRAAGMVRAQGGTEPAIRLGLRTQEFYAASGDRFPLDCGFVAQGYLMPCFSDAEVQQADDRIALQQSLGGRWLTAEEYRLGDVVIFNMTLVHGSLDNSTDRIRLSTDTRYQLTSELADERWLGDKPAGHVAAMKRGRIC